VAAPPPCTACPNVSRPSHPPQRCSR